MTKAMTHPSLWTTKNKCSAMSLLEPHMICTSTKANRQRRSPLTWIQTAKILKMKNLSNRLADSFFLWIRQLTKSFLKTKRWTTCPLEPTVRMFRFLVEHGQHLWILMFFAFTFVNYFHTFNSFERSYVLSDFSFFLVSWNGDPRWCQDLRACGERNGMFWSA